MLDNEAAANAAQQLQNLTQQAVAVLTCYGAAAQPLQQLAQHMAARAE